MGTIAISQGSSKKTRQRSHWLICGPTGTGKSTLIETKVMDRLDWDVSIVGIFPHKGDIGTRLAERIFNHDPERLIWDCAGSLDRVLPLRRSLPSTKEDQYARRVENDETKHRLIEAMLARRVQQNIYEMPLIEDGLDRGLGLWLNQVTPKPESWIPKSFEPGTDQFNAMLGECSDQDAFRRATEVNTWTKQERLKTLLPAKRVVDGAFGNPVYLSRTNGSVSLGELIDQRKVCVFEGDRVVARSGVRFWFITLIHEVCRHVERGSDCPVILIIDEANAWMLIDPYVCRMMAELRKDMLQVWISVQRPGFGDEETLEDVLTNCNRIYCFRPQSQQVAQMMGFLMGMPIVDPMAVHWIEERHRQVHAGYKIAVAESSQESETKGTSLTEGWMESHTDGKSSSNSDSETRGTTSTWSEGESESTTKTIGRSSGTGADGKSTSGSFSSIGETEGSNSSRGGSASLSNTRGKQKGKSSSDTKGKSGSVGTSKSNTSGTGRSEQYLSEFEQVTDDVPHYFSTDEQVKLITASMMRMGVGEAIVKDHGDVWIENIRKVPEIEDLECVKKLVTEELRSYIKSQPIYTKPTVPEFPKRQSAAERARRGRSGGSEQ